MGSQGQVLRGISLYREKVVRLQETLWQGKCWSLFGFCVLGSAVNPRSVKPPPPHTHTHTPCCNKVLISPSSKPGVHLFSLTDSAFSLQWSGSRPPGSPLWGLLCPPPWAQEAASALPRSLVSCFHLTLAPTRYVLKELWRECFARLSEVPKSCRKLGKRWRVDLRVACGDLKCKA